MIKQKHDKTKGKQRKEYKTLRKLHRGIDSPPADKMIKEAPTKKEIWEPLVIREQNIHSGEVV